MQSVYNSHPPPDNLATASPRHSFSVTLQNIQEILWSHILVLYEVTTCHCHDLHDATLILWLHVYTFMHSLLILHVMQYPNLFGIVMGNSRIHIGAINLKPNKKEERNVYTCWKQN